MKELKEWIMLIGILGIALALTGIPGIVINNLINR